MSSNIVNTLLEVYEKIKKVKKMLTDEELGRRLKRERQRLGLSQIYLADLLHHDQTYVSKVETGKRQLTVVDFQCWCRALNLTDKEQIKLINSENKNDE